LEGTFVGSRPTGRPRSRWDENIKADFKEISWEGVNWIHLAEGRDHRHVIVNIVIKSR
jgi:hypothetical protein